jgi:hypothetical protein
MIKSMVIHSSFWEQWGQHFTDGNSQFLVVGLQIDFVGEAPNRHPTQDALTNLKRELTFFERADFPCLTLILTGLDISQEDPGKAGEINPNEWEEVKKVVGKMEKKYHILFNS